MANYAILDSENLCVNVVVWDGVAQWCPPEGHYLKELLADDHAGIGWKWDAAANQWIDVRPPVEPQFTVGI